MSGIRSILLSRLMKNFFIYRTRQYNSIVNPVKYITVNENICRTFGSVYITKNDPKIYKGVESNSEAKLSEKDYLRALHDPDIFGPQTASENYEDFEDEDDIKEQEFIVNQPQRSHRLSTKQYADIIKDHIRNNRIKEAIDVLEIKMIKEDRVKPENYIYNLIIGGCGRAGYSKKAFQLFNKMKQRNLKVTGGTYTALFNACANAPWQNDGLNKANRLREIMLEKGYEPNASNYNAMIKAYGRCGDIFTAFQLVDEMDKKGVEIYVNTMNFVLQACISDKKFGFRHALLVWHKMLRKNLIPDIYSFNLMLTCVRDCELGDLETTKEVISKILLSSLSQESDKIESEKTIPLLPNMPKMVKETNPSVSYINTNPISLDLSDNDKQSVEIMASITNPEQSTPNLLCKTPHLGNLVALGEIKKPEDRLLLLGGVSGFLKEMEQYNINPDIKTFTELLEVVPPTTAAEKMLLSAIRKQGLKVDIDFFNVLIKKRSMRFDYNGAKEVLSMIKTAKLLPDIVTYGVLALGCQAQNEAEELLARMEEADIRINIQILGAMLWQGCATRNFPYVIFIMDLAEKEGIKPSEKFITTLHKFYMHCCTLKKQKHRYATEKNFNSKFNQFTQRFELWKRENNLNNLSLEESVKKVQEHPWKQFQENQPEGFEKVKNEKKQHKKKPLRSIKKLNPDKFSNENHVQ